MTFRQSLYLSVFFHLLVFGSALAFAQFARGTFWHYPHAVQVSLVSPGPMEEVRAGMIRQQHKQPRSISPRPAEIAAEGPAANPIEVSTDSGASQQPVNEGNKPSGGEASSHGGVWTAAPDGAGHEGSEEAGFIAPDQWAVIESAIEKSKNYPRMARERGIQGVVRVRFKLKLSGEMERVEIVKSSGYDILDDASVRTVYRAAPLPYVDGWVEVPIAYILR